MMRHTQTEKNPPEIFIELSVTICFVESNNKEFGLVFYISLFFNFPGNLFLSCFIKAFNQQ